jgi:sec-independent protein translocase protein TatB
MAADFQRQFEEAVRDSEIDEVRKAMQDFHAEVSDVTPRGTVDKPLMMPTPAKQAAPVAAEVSETAPPAPKPKSKPRAKKAKKAPAETGPVNTAAAKSKTPKPRAKKREESAS